MFDPTRSFSWQFRGGGCGLRGRCALPFACPGIVKKSLCTPEIQKRRLPAKAPRAIGRAEEVAAFDQVPLCLLSLLPVQKFNRRLLVRRISQEPCA